MMRIALLAVALLSATASHVDAQTFPTKPVRVVIPYQPGGGTDILTRILTPDLSNSLGQQVVVDNRPGGGTVIGTEIVAKAPPDGYTLLASDSAFLINPGLMGSKLPYDTAKDFVGVTMMASGPVVLLVHPSVPVNSIQELIAYAKANPGKLNYASGGNGTSPHLAGELLKQVTGTDIVHVPYKGTAPAMTDLLGGQVQMMFGGISSGRKYVENNQLKALALTGTKRNAALPDVTTFDEAGLRGVNAESYWGVYAPAGTPADAIATLNEQFVRALKNPKTVERLADLGYDIVANTPQEHTAQMQNQIAHWSGVIKKADIKVD